MTGGTEIILKLPASVKAFPIQDSKNTYAFKYGPVLLSAKLGSKDMIKTTTGVNVTIPAKSLFDTSKLPSGTETVKVTKGTPEEFIADIVQHLTRDPSREGAVFVLTGTAAKLEFVPHFPQFRERYAIYLKFR